METVQEWEVKVVMVKAMIQDLVQNVDQKMMILGVISFVVAGKNIYGSIGIHPNSTTNNLADLNELLTIKKKSKKIIAFGETGLDYFYKRSEKNDQIQSFEKHIEFAISEQVPVIIHTRDSDEDTISIIKKYYTKTKFLIHCFTGSLDFAKNLLDLECLISFSGIITFKKSTDLRNVVKYVPMEKMLIETDSPYLSPDPFRGKSNEPANVKIVAENIALIKEISFEEVANLTTSNFNKFFFNEQQN